MNTSFFTATVPSRTKTLVDELQDNKPLFLESFYLSGGTGLSLQLGHRESEDLDFFCEKSFNQLHLEKELTKFGSLEGTELSSGTLNTFLNGVKLQFLEYPYNLLESTVDWNGIKISSVADIACTKLQTVSMRGNKKDFVDIYFLLDLYSLPELLVKAQQKYSGINYNQAHILKSLVYFDDAEQQPMPRMLKEVNWNAIKDRIVNTVKEINF